MYMLFWTTLRIRENKQEQMLLLGGWRKTLTHENEAPTAGAFNTAQLTELLLSIQLGNTG